MGQIANGMARGLRTYGLEMQSRYDGSNRKWHGKGMKNIQPGNSEQVRWARWRMAWKRDQGRTC